MKYAEIDARAASNMSTRQQASVLAIRRARVIARSIVERGGRLVASGASDSSVRRHAFEVVQSYDCKLAALAEVNLKYAHGRIAIEDLRHEASLLNCFRELSEPVRVRTQRKTNGGHRPVLDFGPRHKARQLLVTWALRPWLMKQFSSDQYHLNGGASAASLEVCAELERGAKFAIEHDIKNFYPSISMEYLKRMLPLPSPVVEHVVGARQLRLAATDAISLRLINVCRTGIPQGSSLSPLIAEFVVSNVLNSVPSGSKRVVFVDNILTLTQSRREAEDGDMSLVDAFVHHPAGNFSLTTSGVRRVCDGFDFLGHNFRRTGGDVRVAASMMNRRLFVARVYEKLLLTDGPITRIGLERSAEKYVRDWSRAFSLWRNSRVWAREALNCSIERRTSSVDVVVRDANLRINYRSLTDMMCPGFR